MDFQLADTISVKLIDRNTNKTILEGETVSGKNFPYTRAIEIGLGTKIEIRDTVYEQFICKYKDVIDKKYDIKVKRLNRWWYSVYFGEKKERK